MTAQSLQQYLHEHIPLSRAMGVRVDEVGPERVVLTAPLEPNVNHRESAFGGSLAALAMLAGWSLTHHRLRSLGRECRLVVAGNSTRYLRPALGEFTATTGAVPEEDWQRLFEMLKRKGRGRIALHVDVHSEGALVAEFDARFAAVTDAGRPAG